MSRSAARSSRRWRRGEREGLAGRIGEVGHDVGELDLAALLGRGCAAVGLGRAVAVLGPQLVVARLVGGEGLQGAEIGRGRDERGVAGREQ